MNPLPDIPDAELATGARPWKAGVQDDGALHALGNGRLCAYGRGPEIEQLFGPGLSSCNFLELRIDEASGLESNSRRLRGAAAWRHKLRRGGEAIGRAWDWIDPDRPVFQRAFALDAPLTLELRAQPEADVFPADTLLPGYRHALLLRLPPGLPVFFDYPTGSERWLLAIMEGTPGSATGPPASRWRLSLASGHARLLFAAGRSLPEALDHAEAALAEAPQHSFNRMRRDWQGFSARRHQSPALDELAIADSLDDVATLIRAQQSVDGAVLAGQLYHLGYVRDQYGVARGLLALGHHDEARAILEKLWRVWQQRGHIHNAHGIEADHIIHAHENDLVEITGYLLLQCFDYAARSGEHDYPRRVLPMLEWCFDSQASQLAGGMLPFNGDETFVAGGILSRARLNDGSAEATLLFLLGGQALCDYVARHRLWPTERLEAARRQLDETHRLYPANFLDGHRYLTNQPARLDHATPPRLRHGVCEGGCPRFGWTQRNHQGRYLCPRCLQEKEPAPEKARARSIPSTALLPPFLDAPLPPLDQLRPTIETLAGQFLEDRASGNPRLVGYDPGLLLGAMQALGHPRADDLRRAMLALRDSAGAWVEYYDEGRPAGCRCRPWESAINAAALVESLQPSPNLSTQPTPTPGATPA